MLSIVNGVFSFNCEHLSLYIFEQLIGRAELETVELYNFQKQTSLKGLDVLLQVKNLSVSGELTQMRPFTFQWAYVLQLKELRSLELEGLGISLLHPEINRLEKLEVLKLKSNLLIRVPETLWEMKTLKHLDLTDNWISKTYLDSKKSLLPSLETFLVEENQPC